MKNKLNEIYNILDNIQYGYIYDGVDISDDQYKFGECYRLLNPDYLLNIKYGVCWDQVELERKLFDDNNIYNKSYFIYINDHDGLPSHTFMVVQDNDKYIWFEHAWYDYKGIHEYNSLDELLEDVINKFIKSHEDIKFEELLVYEYTKPNYGITCEEFYNYLETQKLVIERKY